MHTLVTTVLVVTFGIYIFAHAQCSELVSPIHKKNGRPWNIPQGLVRCLIAPRIGLWLSAIIVTVIWQIEH